MIDTEEVKRIAALAHLELDADTVERFRRQLQRILDYVEMLDTLDVSEIPPTAHRLERGQSARPDEVVPPIPREDALLNAPDAAEGHFRVPRVLEE